MKNEPQSSGGTSAGGPTGTSLATIRMQARLCPKCEQYSKLVSQITDELRNKLFIQEEWDCLACGSIRATYWFSPPHGQGHP